MAIHIGLDRMVKGSVCAGKNIQVQGTSAVYTRMLAEAVRFALLMQSKNEEARRGGVQLAGQWPRKPTC